MQVQPVSVADAVADALRQRLLGGHYRGGEQLKDTDLSAEFGVARPTVRAAVQMLVADGLLERGRGRSAAVRSFTAEDAVDLFRVRRPLEQVAVRMVVDRLAGVGGPGDPGGAGVLDGVAVAARALSGLGEEVSWDVVADHDVAFHRQVFVVAGSPRLLRHFDEVGTELRLMIAQLRPAYDSVRDLAREHEGLLAALRSGDPARAAAAWDEHFDDALRFFLDLISPGTRLGTPPAHSPDPNQEQTR